MLLASRSGWRLLSCWGADGWDLGAWPYVSFQLAERPEPPRFLLQQIVEGDHDRYAFETDGDRDAALDYLFLWHSAGKDWSPLTYEQRSALDEGRIEVEPRFRGPYRPSPSNATLI